MDSVVSLEIPAGSETAPVCSFLTYTPVCIPPHHQASILPELLWT